MAKQIKLEEIFWKDGKFVDGTNHEVKEKAIGEPILTLLNKDESFIDYLDEEVLEKCNAYVQKTISIDSQILKQTSVYSAIQLYKITRE
jgi:hypothetical protein